MKAHQKVRVPNARPQRKIFTPVRVHIRRRQDSRVIVKRVSHPFATVVNAPRNATHRERMNFRRNRGNDPLDTAVALGDLQARAGSSLALRTEAFEVGLLALGASITGRSTAARDRRVADILEDLDGGYGQLVAWGEVAPRVVRRRGRAFVLDVPDASGRLGARYLRAVLGQDATALTTFIPRHQRADEREDEVLLLASSVLRVLERSTDHVLLGRALDAAAERRRAIEDGHWLALMREWWKL